MLGLSSKWQLDNPKVSLTIFFITWEVLLVIIALTSPSPGYDTSTTLLTEPRVPRQDGEHADGTILHVLASKLTRWDAIYFANAGHRGALFEQEWAFGWGYAKTIGITSRVLFAAQSGVVETAVAGILISNIAHLLSVLVLYQTSKLVGSKPSSRETQVFAFISASLHIISPAGLFLSAPYAESSFSFLNFVGFHLYASSLQAHHGGRSGQRDVLVMASGIAFGLATTLRSNGLLSGLLFFYDILSSCFTVLEDVQSRTVVSGLRRIIVLVIAGLVTAVGSVFPQCLAYKEYCHKIKPEHQALWNVGLFRYWTLSNAPLFILATPMLLLLTVSALGFLPLRSTPSSSTDRKSEPASPPGDRDWLSAVGVDVARHLAIPQLLLALLAFTTYHVQIVTRISSGYPLWYWWLASKITANGGFQLAGCRIGMKAVVMWMVIYACLQAGLFAAFLPPA
ncbi:MAG: hypothetical protein Q9168_002682 [Polycauliona sp. 1 TL-2023]